MKIQNLGPFQMSQNFKYERLSRFKNLNVHVSKVSKIHNTSSMYSLKIQTRIYLLLNVKVANNISRIFQPYGKHGNLPVGAVFWIKAQVPLMRFFGGTWHKAKCQPLCSRWTSYALQGAPINSETLQGGPILAFLKVRLFLGAMVF